MPNLKFKMKFFFIFTFALIPFKNTSANEVIQIVSKISLDFTGCALLENTTAAFTYDKSCIESFYDNHPMTLTSLPQWQEVMKKPVSERLVVADEEMLQYMRLDNLLYDFPYENIKAATDPKLLEGARLAISELPPALNRYINDHFYGFMLVSGVGWTGFASSIRAVAGNPLKAGAVIIINADNIKDRTLNEWLAFREKTTFNFFASLDPNQYPQYDLKMKYTKNGQASSLKDNLRHFLIHEAAHLIVNAEPSIHPDFKYRNKPVPFSEFQKWQQPNSPLEKSFPFLTYSWVLEKTETTNNEPAFLLSRNVPSYMAPVLLAKKIKFYSTDTASQFTRDEAIKLYKGLNKTCFPSLYGMVDYSEDFAETVTHYFMSYVEKHSYVVTLTEKLSAKKKTRVLARFKDRLWKKSACREKLEFMKELFETNN